MALRLFTDRVWNTKLGSKRLLGGIALAFGGIVFLVSELMHYLMVPDLGRHSERMVAEALSGLVVGLLAAKLSSRAIERRAMVGARLQVIEAMNHHIRNALDVISLSTYTIHDNQSVAAISQAVDRIEWALREILPRDAPVSEAERERLLFFDCEKVEQKPQQNRA